MKLTRLRLHNFRSYVDADLAFSSGQNYIFGKNWQGKSSIMDAIGYALFGKRILPARLSGTAVKMEHLVRDGAESGWVELEFVHQGHRYLLHRAVPRDAPFLLQNRKKIASGVIPTGEHLAEILGVDADLFANIFYSGQDELRRVLELTPEDRRVFIETVLGFDYLKDVKMSARHVSDALQKWIEGAFSADLKATLQRSTGAEARIREIVDRIQQLDREIATQGDPQGHSGTVEMHASAAGERQDHCLEEIGALKAQDHIFSDLVQGVASGTCPACGQEVPDAARSAALAHLSRMIEEIRERVLQAEEQLDRVNIDLMEADRVRGDLKTSLVNLAGMQAERDALYNELTFREEEIGLIKEEIRAYQDRDRIQKLVQDERRFLEELQQAIDEFRAMVRAVVTQDLEDAVNSFMIRFGDGDFDAQLVITRDFGLQTLLRGHEVPLFNLSGAARDILAFSLRYGLYRLAAKEIDFILLDEPTRHFDRKNTMKLKAALNELDGHQVIIITVNDDFSDAVGKKFIVEKDESRHSVIREI
jgi:DNA repair exonuclease SbcCD ATPase subunit